MIYLENMKTDIEKDINETRFDQSLDGYVGILSPPSNLSLLLFEPLTLFDHTQALHQQGHDRFSAASVFHTGKCKDIFNT